MPKLLATEEVITTGSFGYSAVKPDELEEAEFTLATIVCDVTGSVSPFADELLNMVKVAIKTCQKSPRSNNMLIRYINFNDKVKEIHGFRLLSEIDVNTYDPIQPWGMTALFDAQMDAINATVNYSKSLIDQEFDVNAVIFIITDGADNHSSSTPTMIKKEQQSIVRNEEFGGLQQYLIGINANDCKTELERFQTEAGLTDYIDAGDATPSNLAKIAQFISSSVSSSSQALATGTQQSSLTL